LEIKFSKKLRKFLKKFAKLQIIMLLPMMREDLFDELNEHGIDMGIGKPVMPSILLNVILDIFNLKAVSGSRPTTVKGPVPTKMDRQYLVLLAEDNKTNQLIAKSLLEQIGIETIIANDGKQAVEKYREHRDSIDLILMDLHMPVMNGYEAAERIREISDRVPIAAMTADVILGVRERCEQSGISYYISKPFDPDRFVQIIKDILLENRPGIDTDTAVLDKQMGLRNIGGSEELYHQVLEEYRKENQDTLDRLEAAVSEKRYTDTVQIAHKVKSSSGSIGARSLQDAAMALQKALNEEKEDEIAQLKARFSELLRKLLEEIKQLQETRM
jgi:two-component system sensor histidine kinase/response regulator